MRSSLSVLALACLLVACSSDPATSDAGSDAGPGDASGMDATSSDAGAKDAAADAPVDAPVDTGVDAPPCGPLTLPLPGNVQIFQAGTMPPVPAGGAIAPGTYHLTGASYFNGLGGPYGKSRAAALVFTASTYERAYHPDTKVGSVDRTSGTFSAGGSMLTRTAACPTASLPVAQGYTATAGQLRLIFLEGSYVMEETYTKQ
jgi:hypothetical protein